MCEFCNKHGEGKKWYLQMKNYAEELLHEELSPRQKELAGVSTRHEWCLRFWRDDVMPAVTGVTEAPEQAEDSGPPPEPPPSEDEIVDRWMETHFGQVLPLEDVEKVLDMADSITRFPCGCRFFTTGKADKRYCFGLGLDKWGILGEFPDAASSLEVLEKEEAKRIIRAYDTEGLMHSIWTGITPYAFGICNCDHDCAPYRRYIEKKGTPSFFRAEYICQVDWDMCTGCKACMSQCQFGAQFYSSALGKVHIDPARCFGCGVCRAVCPTDAIRLVPRESHPDAAGIWLRDAVA